MNVQKQTTPDYPVHELIARRWSPYAFADRPVSDDDLRSMFEAARWAASSYNEQPWAYIVATKANLDQFERLLSCLVVGNQLWAKAAPVLALGCTSLSFALNGKPNAAAVHDLGIGSASMTLEATARGLFVHQMIGILPDKKRKRGHRTLFPVVNLLEERGRVHRGLARPAARAQARFQTQLLRRRLGKMVTLHVSICKHVGCIDIFVRVQDGRNGSAEFPFATVAAALAQAL